MAGENAVCCCAPAIPEAPYIIGSTETSVGAVPAVKTELSAKDVLGAFRVRWGIGRMNYKVEPGIYSIGKPDENSPVLVTANYKLTFDSLRKELTGLNLWILVLNTKGVNVWCAAGKGTFGTKELVFRIKAVKLGEIVKHRTLILPQLGATGVAAHAVTKLSGFHVVYGPVRATDIPEFLKAGMKATPEMREVKFTIKDRVVLTPVDLVYWMKPLVLFFGALFVLNAIGLGRFGLSELIGFLGAVITGCVITPILLPWIPGRAFSLKGALLGVIWAAASIFLGGGFAGLGVLKAISYILLLPSVSAYTGMNFTGSSTYTSPTGVNKEMHIAIPIILGVSFLGMIALIVDSIIKIFS
ncbi:MAG TPA: mercury methylation corrinoid protein HgcA [Ruminiclostridium sp.]|nr:mercury methylation corrinoid protein HgcA [Ruminiclostridium sp.]